MPRKNGHAKRKSSASATPPPPATARRRAPPPLQEPSVPALPEDFPEHATLLPAPPEAPYSLPASPGADDPGDVPRSESLPVAFSPALMEALTALWPDLQAMVQWWQERQRLAQQEEAPDRKRTRQTYHIEQRYSDAVQREADRTGESPAAVVNRALAHYFAGR